MVESVAKPPEPPPASPGAPPPAGKPPEAPPKGDVTAAPPPKGGDEAFEADYQRRFKGDPKLLHESYRKAQKELGRTKEQLNILKAAAKKTAPPPGKPGQAPAGDKTPPARAMPVFSLPIGPVDGQIEAIAKERDAKLADLDAELVKLDAMPAFDDEDPAATAKRKGEIRREIREAQANASEAEREVRANAEEIGVFRKNFVFSFEKNNPDLADAILADDFRFITSRETSAVAQEAAENGVDLTQMPRSKVSAYFAEHVMPRVVAGMTKRRDELLVWAREYDKQTAALKEKRKAAVHVEGDGLRPEPEKPDSEEQRRIQALADAPRPRR